MPPRGRPYTGFPAIAGPAPTVGDGLVPSLIGNHGKPGPTAPWGLDAMIMGGTGAAKMPSTDQSIEVFQDLYLTCSGNNGSDLKGVLVGHARSPWRHACDAEDQIEKTYPDAGLYAVFERAAAGNVPAARLVLYQDAGKYKVVNIVPTECGSLGETGYNDVLNEAIRRRIAPLHPQKTPQVAGTLPVRLGHVSLAPHKRRC